MKLYLVRHAIAEDVSAAASDADRALTREGAGKMRAAAAGLRAIDVRPDLVLTSPLRRARETAEILVEGLAAEVRPLSALEPGADLRKLLRALEPFRSVDSLALVGHHPDLGRLASLLLTGSAGAAPIFFKKGGVACFDAELSRTAAAVHASLEWFMTPKQLRALGQT